MTKLEYDSFYKFIVSLGVALISFAAIVSWLFLREPFDLLIDTTKLSELTPTAQKVIVYKQVIISKILHVVPWISLGFLVVGIVVILIGLYLWHDKQMVIDKQQVLTNEKIQAEIKSLNPSEVISSLATDVTEDIVNSAEEKLPQKEIEEKVSSSISRYLEIENIISSIIAEGFSSTHIALRNKRIGNSEYDLILQSKGSVPFDYVIEIKYIRGVPSYAWLLSKVNEVMFSGRYYLSVTNKPSTSVLIIVAPYERAKILKRHARRIATNTNLSESSVLIEVISEDDLDKITSPQMKEKIEMEF